MSFTTDPAARYAATHEWIRMEGAVAVVGISDHAQQALSDIVYVELPAVGVTFAAGDTFGVVESVKAASDVYLPVAGEIVETNAELDASPEIVNAEPYAGGWLVKIKVDDPAELESLLDEAAYRASVAAEEQKEG
jgi:glycine cleavage system H protein